MNYEMITEGSQSYVKLPIADYEALLAAAEDAADSTAAENALRAMQANAEKGVPMAVAERFLQDEPPLVAWREYRELTQMQLAEKSGVSRGMIAAIETGRKSGSVNSLQKLAAALEISLNDLAL